jgi:hypothetical protein
MAMTAIPKIVEFSIEGSIYANQPACQMAKQGDRMKRRRKWKEHAGAFGLFESE